MTKMLRSILICPATRTVSELYITPGLEGLYYGLGKADTAFSGTVECVGAGNKVGLWIDENGALDAGRPVWTLGPQSFAGAGLILGFDAESGESCDCPVPLAIAQFAVEWTSLETTGDFSAPQTYDDESGFVFVSGQPIYRERIQP